MTIAQNVYIHPDIPYKLKFWFAYVVTTVIKGKRVLCMCMINGNTTTDDVKATVAKLNEIAVDLRKKYIDK